MSGVFRLLAGYVGEAETWEQWRHDADVIQAWRGALLTALSSFRSLSSAEQQRVADDLSRLIENGGHQRNGDCVEQKIR